MGCCTNSDNGGKFEQMPELSEEDQKAALAAAQPNYRLQDIRYDHNVRAETGSQAKKMYLHL